MGVSAYVSAAFFSAYVSDWVPHVPNDLGSLPPGPSRPLSLAVLMGIAVAVALRRRPVPSGGAVRII